MINLNINVLMHLILYNKSQMLDHENSYIDLEVPWFYYSKLIYHENSYNLRSFFTFRGYCCCPSALNSKNQLQIVSF